MKTTTNSPYLFTAKCQLTEIHPRAELTRDDLKRCEPSRYDRKLKAEVVQLPCDFVTDNRAEFERHMRDVHGRRLGQPFADGWENFNKPAWIVQSRKAWKPALNQRCKPFQPVWPAIGAQIVWLESDGGRTTGQIWSAAPGPRSVWALPDDRNPDHGDGAFVLVQATDVSGRDLKSINNFPEPR